MRKLAPNRVAPSPGFKGETPEACYEVLEAVWERAVSLASDYARNNRVPLAFCASMGWISIIRPDGHDIGLSWRLTAAGLHALEDHHNPT